MPFGFPVTPVDVALSADAIEIPKGHPGAILRAAGALSATASQLERGSRDVAGAGAAAVRAADGWNGIAASSFETLAGMLGAKMHGGVGALRQAAAACKAFGNDLDEQQDVARQSLRAAQDAEGRAKAAVSAAQRASADEIAANLDADAAAAAGAVARAGADRAGATHHAQRERAARDQAGQARAATGRARALLADANDEIQRAAERAQIAKQRADDAARRAQAALHHAAAAAKAARIDLAPIPVPVAPTPVSANPFGGIAPFALPFRAPAPGDVRRHQIGRHQIDDAAERAREAERDRPLNGLESLGRTLFSTGFAPIDGATFGAAGALVHKSPGGKRLYGSDAGGAKLTQFILPGHAGERAAAAGGRAIAKRLPSGPIEPILYIGGTFAPAKRLDLRSLPPIKVKVSRDGKVTELAIRPAGTESRVNDERHLAPKQASGDGREAASLVARILINVDKAVDHAHVPPHFGG